MTRLRAAALPGALPPAAALLAALLLTGCGVRSTDAIDAGGPATIQVFPAGGGGRALLFFRSEEALMPVARSVPYDASVDPAAADPPTVDPETSGKALAELFAGPIPEEREAGLTDGLPDLPEGDGEGGFEVELAEDGQSSVTLPVALGRLDDLAIRQVICTVAYALDDEGRGVVRLRGTDGALEAAGCDADIDSGSRPRPRTAPDPDRP